MPLIDRIFHDDPGESRDMSNHAFSAYAWFWATGRATRADVIAAFNMTTEDETQLDQLAVHYGTLTPTEQDRFHGDLEGAGLLAEGGFITKAKYKSLLGLT